MGKNFSGTNKGQRKESDFYETPYSITQQLLTSHYFDDNKTTLEPACGDGAIVKVLRNNNFTKIRYYDKETDFILETQTYEQIITNPPFSIANEFILKAKQVASETFAFLLPL